MQSVLPKNEHSKQKYDVIMTLRECSTVPHAKPFTTHTELLDTDTLDYRLTIVDELVEIRVKRLFPQR